MSLALIADLVLVAHFGVVLVIIGGLVAVVIGNTVASWPWVNQRWFRGMHALAILVVVAQAWLGKLCPLTTLEFWLREKAGAEHAAAESFIAHWLHRLLYVEVSLWVLAVVYSAFAALVALAWWKFPPRRHLEAGPES